VLEREVLLRLRDVVGLGWYGVIGVSRTYLTKLRLYIDVHRRDYFEDLIFAPMIPFLSAMPAQNAQYSQRKMPSIDYKVDSRRSNIPFPRPMFTYTHPPLSKNPYCCGATLNLQRSILSLCCGLIASSYPPAAIGIPIGVIGIAMFMFIGMKAIC
jgi:hypothetical protein